MPKTLEIKKIVQKTCLHVTLPEQLGSSFKMKHTQLLGKEKCNNICRNAYSDLSPINVVNILLIVCIIVVFVVSKNH